MRGKNTLSSEIRIPGERAGDKPSLLKKFGMILVNLYSLRNPNLARIFEYFKSKCNVPIQNFLSYDLNVCHQIFRSYCPNPFPIFPYHFLFSTFLKHCGMYYLWNGLHQWKWTKKKKLWGLTMPRMKMCVAKKLEHWELAQVCHPT